VPDLVSVNGHKVHGPKGIGALRVRRGLALEPLVHGGGQEGGLRAGTSPTPLIAGFGRAVEIVPANEPGRIAALRDAFVERVLARIPGVLLNGPRSDACATTRTCRFRACRVGSLVAALDREGVVVSRGSACSSGSTLPSPVLKAIGRSDAEALGALRVSLGRYTTAGEL